MIFLRPGRISYVGLKSFFSSTPRLRLGRSRTCPIDALTVKLRPRNLLIVFALAGDSTMTSDLPKKTLLRPRRGPYRWTNIGGCQILQARCLSGAARSRLQKISRARARDHDPPQLEPQERHLQGRRGKPGGASDRFRILAARAE